MFLSKKIFIVSSSLLLVVLLFWGIYFFSFQKPSAGKETTNTSQTSTTAGSGKEAAPIKEERIQQLTTDAVLAPVFSGADNTVKYYAKSTGKAYVIDLMDLSTKILSDTNLPGLIDVFWSPDQSKVITKFASGTDSSKFFSYDYTTRTGIALSGNTNAVAWQNNNKIFYTYLDKKAKEKSINLADPDGKNWHKIISFSPDNILIAPIPMSGFVSFWNKPDSFSQTLMQSTPALGGETKTLSAETFGADYLWNANGTLLLRSNVDQKGGHLMGLGFSNNLGGEYKNLGVPTFVSKCAWSKNNEFIFYALPGAIPEKSILPNDYANNLFTTKDTFWKINLKTGEKTRLIPLEELTEAYDATNLFLDANESYLFFTNKIDGKLYRIRL